MFLVAKSSSFQEPKLRRNEGEKRKTGEKKSCEELQRDENGNTRKNNLY